MDPQTLAGIPGFFAEVFEVRWTALLVRQDNNPILAHIKTLAGWIHQLAPFPLGNPVQEIKLMPVGSSLDVDRALSSAERRRLLDAADLLPSVAGRSKDRRRNKNIDPVDRPIRKNARPWRNRAIVYALMETGMRRAAVVNLNIEGIDWEDRLVAVTEKGGMIHSYPISDQGLQSIRDYITHERQMDNTDLLYALFLPAMTTHNSNGRLTPLVVNQEWEEVCAIAKQDGQHRCGCSGSLVIEMLLTRCNMRGSQIKRCGMS